MESTSSIRALAAVGPKDTTVSEWAYEPRPLFPDDVEIKITAAGVCHSDLHQILQEWGDNTEKRPFVPGHEIVGHVVRVGPNATSSFKVGDRVAVGVAVGSCGKCAQCAQRDEIYCPELVDCYMGKYRGYRTYGGYAERVVVDSRFVFKVPANLPSTSAAPLMCAGNTVFSPLRRHFKEGSTVGVLGIGGLGHIALQFARALGYAKVVGLTTSKDKVEAAKKFGAQEVILCSEKDAMKANEQTLDLLLVTASSDGLPWDDYVKLLRTGGMMCVVGLPPSRRISLPLVPFVNHRREFSGSLVGGTKDSEDMLRVAAAHGVRVAVELHPLDAKGANEALERVKENKARFRCVLIPGGPAEMDKARKETEEGSTSF